MTQESLHSYLVTELPASPDPLAESAAAYATEVADLLFNQLQDVVRSRAPELEPVLVGESRPAPRSWRPGRSRSWASGCSC